jgi:hypothetical protein
VSPVSPKNTKKTQAFLKNVETEIKTRNCPEKIFGQPQGLGALKRVCTPSPIPFENNAELALRFLILKI